jgi:putative inorganic carbon (HCO3(-)) transporter
VRDLALTAFILGSLPFILRRPQLGVLMYVWISVMNPHRLTWSFAAEFQFAAIVAVTTLIGLLFSKELKWPPVNALTIVLVSFAGWTGVTTIFALYPEPSYEMWKTLVKTQLMALLIPMLFHKKEDLRLLLWVLVLSIAYYGTKGGIWTLATGGAERVWGPAGSYVAGNNEVAVAIVMMIPLMWYLRLTSPHKYVRAALIAMMVFCAVAVLGTYSRGAILAASAMGAFLWWKSRSKVPVLLVALLAVPLALATMPEKWYARMDTIVNYEQDGSASRRLNAWATMFNLAKDRPVVGGGFEVARPEVYARYSPDPTYPPQVAHSIYLQAMGEHGFVGFALYVVLLYGLWVAASKIIRIAKDRANLQWAYDFSLMMQVSLIGFAVGGAFLSLVNFDVPYYLVGIMAATLSLVRREAADEARATLQETPHTSYAAAARARRVSP